MRRMKRVAAVAALTLGAATMGIATASAGDMPEEIHIQGECGDDYDIETSGARAGASLWCSGGTIYIDGWVEDTAADGECAEVHGNIGSNKFRSPTACPKGDKEWFSYEGPGSTAYVYLREF